MQRYLSRMSLGEQMQTCFSTPQMPNSACLHECMCRTIYAHSETFIDRRTGPITTGGSGSSSVIAHQAAARAGEASIRLKPALLGPPVDYSGKDKQSGAAIHSQQPPLGLETPEEFRCQRGTRDPPLHTGSTRVVCLCCINHRDKQLYRGMEAGYKSITTLSE